MDSEEDSNENCVASGLPDETKLGLFNQLEELENTENYFIPFANEFERLVTSEVKAAARTRSIPDVQFTLQVSDQSSGVATNRLAKDDDIVSLMESLSRADGRTLDSWCPNEFAQLEEMTKAFRLAPSFAWKAFDLQSFNEFQSKLPDPVKPKERKPRVQTVAKAASTVTRLKVVENVNSDLQNHLNSALDVILRLTSPPNEPDVAFFRLVLHPKSFPNTVYNIYLMSFLTNERLLGISVKDDQELYVTPIRKNISLQPKQRSIIQPFQCIVSLSVLEWHDLVRVLHIDRALLPENCPKESRYFGKDGTCDDVSTGVIFLDP